MSDRVTLDRGNRGDKRAHVGCYSDSVAEGGQCARSETGHSRPNASQHNFVLFDYLVGAGEQH